jgi:multiple sugar transport system permease protein
MISANAAHSVVEPSPGTMRFAGSLVILYAVITMVPLIWIVLTSFKSPDDAISYPPKVLFEPSLEGYCNLFTTRSRQTPEFIRTLGPAQGLCDGIARDRNMVVAGPSNYVPRFINSLIIAFGSTVLAVALGTLSAYGFSRFRVPLKDDLLFFILSTRMMPPIAVAIPIYLMYRTIGLSDTRLGMILLYTSVNVSLAVWLLKGFIDEIPREYEEAVLLTSGNAQTAPPFIPIIIGEGGQDWPAVAAGTTLFLVPIVVFTVLLRKHLLRGITFGAVRK